MKKKDRRTKGDKGKRERERESGDRGEGR